MSVLHSEFRDWARRLTPVEILQMLVADMPSHEQAALLDEAGVSLVGMHGALVLRDYGREYLGKHRILAFDNERTGMRGSSGALHQRLTINIDFELERAKCKSCGGDGKGQVYSDGLDTFLLDCGACGGLGYTT